MSIRYKKKTVKQINTLFYLSSNIKLQHWKGEKNPFPKHLTSPSFFPIRRHCFTLTNTVCIEKCLINEVFPVYVTAPLALGKIDG